MRQKRRRQSSDGLTVREWVQLYTKFSPPFPAALLDRPISTTPRRCLRPIGAWMAAKTAVDVDLPND